MCAIPELVHPRQKHSGPVKDIARVVDGAVPHLHFRILKPDDNIAVIRVKCTLVD